MIGTPKTISASAVRMKKLIMPIATYGSCLPSRYSSLPGRRDVEVDHRAELLLAHDADRHQNRRDQEQQQRRDARHDRVDALERRVVHVALFDVGRVLREARRSAVRSRDPAAWCRARPATYCSTVSPRNVMAPSTCARTSGPEPRRKSLPKLRRDLEDHRDVVRLQPLERLVGGAGRRRAGEVARRAGELLEVRAALGRLIEIERRVADVLDVGGDAEAEDEHQQRRADEGERQSDRIAEDLHGLVARVGEHPADAQPRGRTAAPRAGGGAAARRRRLVGRGLALGLGARRPRRSRPPCSAMKASSRLGGAARRRSASAARRRPAPCPRS